MNDTKNELDIIELTQENIESMIYTIRGQRVMLDFDLARIYGYETKDFNRQVKNNIEKFPEDFMFQINEAESKLLVRCKNFTSRNPNLFSGNKGGTRYLPYAFTEQGIYMLMTVLKGELAIKQSQALIRLFKKMKDYIKENDFNAALINQKFETYDNRLGVVEAKLDVVMDNFMDPSTYKHFLIMNGEKLEADIAYQSIYKLAKQSIYIIDDYIDVKTLLLLRVIPSSVEIVVFTDNVSKNSITKEFLDDFLLKNKRQIIFKPTKKRIHDRYIVIDYQKESEKIYHCGASSKDTGNKVSTINLIDDKEVYHPLIETFLLHENIDMIHQV